MRQCLAEWIKNFKAYGLQLRNSTYLFLTLRNSHTRAQETMYKGVDFKSLAVAKIIVVPKYSLLR